MTEPLPTSDTREQVLAIIARQASIDAASIRDDATLKDLGMTSLEAIEVIFDIEEQFDISFPEQDANFSVDTVQHLVAAVAAARTAGKDGGR